MCDPFYTLSTYEPADISYCLKHSCIHNQIDAHTLRIVRIVLCFDCMDKSKYGQLYPFCFCIPHSTDVTILYSNLSLGLQSHFIFDIM